MPSIFCARRVAIRSFGSRELGVDEELDRVVARLAVNVDRARIVRRAVVVEKVVVGEPAARVGDRNQLARARMIQADRALAFLVQHALDTGQAAQQLRDFAHEFRSRHVDMRDLVIGDGKGIGRAGDRAVRGPAPRARGASRPGAAPGSRESDSRPR